jgi:hypothetical protein
MTRLVAGWAAAVALAACSQDAAIVPRAFEVADSSGVVMAHNQAGAMPACAVSDAPSVSIGEADGEEAYQFYRLFGATRLSDGRIAVVNEFRDAFYLWQLPGDTIWVGDYRPFQFLVFSPEGEWVRTVRPTPEYANSPGVMSVLDDGRSVLGERNVGSRGGPGYELRYQPVVVHGRDGTLTDTLGVYPNGRWGNVGEEGQPGLYTYPLFESFTRVAAAGTTLVIGHGSEPRLEVFDLGGRPRLTHVISWDPGDRTVTGADVEAAYDEYRARYADSDPATFAALVAPMVSDERPVADVFPAFSDVLIGRDGTIWIREYARPGAAAEQVWTALDARGQLRCSATLDASEIYEFGADYVLVEHFDELDVERVLMYDLELPSES